MFWIGDMYNNLTDLNNYFDLHFYLFICPSKKFSLKPLKCIEGLEIQSYGINMKNP